MLPITPLPIQHSKHFIFGRPRHGVERVRPRPDAELLVGEALQLERLVGAPFQPCVVLPSAAPLDVAGDGLEHGGRDDDQRAEDEDEAEAEEGEGYVCCAEDFLGGLGY